MRLNFCTLFFANYSAKGIALYRSLEMVCPDFHIYILAMDEACVHLLLDMSLPHATIITIDDVESFMPELRQVKAERSIGEYSWTCKGPTLLYCYSTYGLKSCTYIDSDFYFYSDPTSLYSECPNADVMLMDHGFTKIYNLAETNGRYCAGYIYFRFTDNGLRVLNEWIRQCIEWCYGRHEQGRFGDQKYLDEFHQKFENIHDLENHGLCAPWNIQQYKVHKDKDEQIMVKRNMDVPLVMFHFHFLKNQDFGKMNEFYLGPYYLSNDIFKYIYTPYLNELKRITKYIDQKYTNVDPLASNRYPMSAMEYVWHWCKNFWKKNKIIWKRR